MAGLDRKSFPACLCSIENVPGRIDTSRILRLSKLRLVPDADPSKAGATEKAISLIGLRSQDAPDRSMLAAVHCAGQRLALPAAAFPCPEPRAT